jgi:hypothetical protein
MSKNHEHCATSNNDAVFSSFVGCRAKGFLKDYRDGHENRYLVFDCGWALVFCGTGAYWSSPPDEVSRLIGRARAKLEQTQRDLSGVLALAGEPA